MPKKTLKLLLLPFLALALALAGCTSGGSEDSGGTASSGQSTLQTVLDRGTLRVAVLPDFPPSSSQKANGKFEGFEPDIARELAKALGVKLKLVSSNGDNRLPLMKSQRVDVNISSYTATNERAKSVSFTIPYVAHGASLLFPKSSPIKSYSDLAGKKVSVARGSTNDTIMTNDFPKTEVVRFDTIADAIAAVKADKVDAAVEAYVTVQKAAKKNPELAAIDAPPLKPQLVSMGILPGDPVWLNYLNNFIRNLIASGEDQKLYQKWFPNELPKVVYGLPPAQQK
ncbi:MAG: transporter substrate-binding domain-containing protein [Streptosporangiales bacterium]